MAEGKLAENSELDGGEASEVVIEGSTLNAEQQTAYLALGRSSSRNRFRVGSVAL
ncbi:MAG: hypothetical protein L0Y58_19350 [Verrucomicrobia subdivision 3 bacterium]|nr:hypothetical protein [Limisphaerales bacterium]